MPEVEEVEEKKTQSGGKGNLRLPYGLCERYGITLPDGATPRQAWDALAGEGISPDDVYKAFQHNKLTPEDGLKEIDGIRKPKAEVSQKAEAKPEDKSGGMITSQEPRKVETYYRNTTRSRGMYGTSYYGKTVLEAKPSGEDGHLVFGYPRWDYDGTGNTKNVSAEINAGYDDGEVFGIDFDKVKTVSGNTFEIKEKLKEKGFRFDGETKTWYKGSKPEPKEKNKKKITVYQDGVPHHAYYAEIDGKPHIKFSSSGKMKRQKSNPEDWMKSFKEQLEKQGVQYKIDEGWD